MKTMVSEAVAAPAADDAGTRERVMALIMERGATTAADVASALAITPAAVRRHLSALARKGLVATRERRAYGARERGRPAKVYVPTDAGRNDFVHTYDALAIDLLDYLRQQQHQRVKALRNAGASEDAKRFEQTLGLFGKYGPRYGFDPVMLAAQGYQESQLDQKAKSHVGAIGVMQIMPATGAELKVGDIRVTEANIHGGAKYMDQLMTRYFKDAGFDPANRTLFAFASYNAGPGNIAKMRKLAAERGLNPDKWFNNVEMVTAEKIGIETTTYVRNIFKYYTSYKLMLQAQQERDKARGEAVKK